MSYDGETQRIPALQPRVQPGDTPMPAPLNPARSRAGETEVLPLDELLGAAPSGTGGGSTPVRAQVRSDAQAAWAGARRRTAGWLRSGDHAVIVLTAVVALVLLLVLAALRT